MSHAWIAFWIVLACAEAIAAAKAAGTDYWSQREAAYAVFLPVAKEKYGTVAAGLRVSALQLLDRMIEVGKTEATAA
jgi:hypothetical protein